MANARVRERPRDPREGGVVPATGGEPVSPDVHTRWVHDTEKRRRQMEQQGYGYATETDVNPNHDGWKTTDGVIRNGDLVLMKTDRARADEKAKAARIDRENRDNAQIQRATQEFDTLDGHGQERGGKFISIP